VLSPNNFSPQKKKFDEEQSAQAPHTPRNYGRITLNLEK
jgi:hypothetical protein